MAITDHVIMPGSDYEALCNKMRELTGKTDKFTSSQLLEELANVKGNVVLEDLTVTENGIYVPAEGIDGYGSVTVNVEKGTSDVDVVYVTFKTYDGATELYKRAVVSGNDCMEIVSGGLIDSPVKPSTNTEIYTLSGWALSANGEANANALKNVTEDRTVYAAYTASTRYYTVRFFDGDTLKNTMQVPYGSTAAYTLEKDGYQFNGWQPSNTNITADTDCYAQWITELTFANATWEQIAEISEAGEAANYFAVGDEKDVVVTYSDGTSDTIIVQVAGFNHDDLSDGTGKAGISIICKTVPVYTTALTTVEYTKSNQQYTGQNNALRPALQGDVWNMIPAELQAVIKEVNKLSDSGPSYSTTPTLITSAEKLWALSIDELGHTESTGNANNSIGTQYCSALGNKYALFTYGDKLNTTNGEIAIINAVGTSVKCWTRHIYRNSIWSMCSAYTIQNKVDRVQSKNWQTTKLHVFFGFCV